MRLAKLILIALPVVWATEARSQDSSSSAEERDAVVVDGQRQQKVPDRDAEEADFASPENAEGYDNPGNAINDTAATSSDAADLVHE
jgi:hypothetical protein